MYGIVKQNDGFIDVTSQLENGTNFHLFFPPHHEKSVNEAGPGSQPSVQSRTATILVVEDEPSVLAITETMLTQQGYKVVTAGTPSEAMQKAGSGDHSFDLLLTDVIMPEMNGSELARKIAGMNADIKIVFMSGYSENIIAPHGVLEKGTFFLQKPFTVAQLAETVRTALESGGNQ